MSSVTILLADADQTLLDAERLYLEREGYRIFCVKSGFDALTFIQRIDPDLVILAVDLPGMDGYQICSRLRDENNQVLFIAVFCDESQMLSSRAALMDADDYLAKPIHMRELVARVKLLLQPGRMILRPGEGAEIIQGVHLDPAKHGITVKEKSIFLRQHEYELLSLMISHPGQYYSREALLGEGMGIDLEGQTASIDAHLAHLRAKLEGCPLHMVHDPDLGYRLEG